VEGVSIGSNIESKSGSDPGYLDKVKIIVGIICLGRNFYNIDKNIILT